MDFLSRYATRSSSARHATTPPPHTITMLAAAWYAMPLPTEIHDALRFAASSAVALRRHVYVRRLLDYACPPPMPWRARHYDIWDARYDFADFRHAAIFYCLMILVEVYDIRERPPYIRRRLCWWLSLSDTSRFRLIDAACIYMLFICYLHIYISRAAFRWHCYRLFRLYTLRRYARADAFDAAAAFMLMPPATWCRRQLSERMPLRSPPAVAFSPPCCRRAIIAALRRCYDAERWCRSDERQVLRRVCCFTRYFFSRYFLHYLLRLHAGLHFFRASACFFAEFF